MRFLFKTKNKDKVVAIFDIGSSSVTVGIVKMSADNNFIPSIIKSARSEIKINKDNNVSKLLRETLDAITFSAIEIKKMGHWKIDEIYCVLSSPWYISETRLIKHTKDKYFYFNQKLADDLVKEELLKVNESFSIRYDKLRTKPKMIEHHIMGMSLNGYYVDNPINKMTKSVEINMFISMSPIILLEKIKNTIEKNFYRSPIKFSSFMMDTYVAIRDKYIHPNSYIILDISGEMTDVGIVLNGILKASLSFPFGKKTFFKYMCTKMEIELRDAEEIFGLYCKNDISENYKKEITPLLKSIENSWGEAFIEAVSTLPRNLVLPNTIFLTADNDIKEWFVTVLRTEEHIQKVLEGGKCSVVTLDGPEFLSMCSVEEGTCDPFLMVEAIAVMRKNEKKYV
ncbi:TPA: hypothetical protein DIC38_02370 [Candidatus Nomurabacteria bacterium]|nr:MAG: hypothetical protein O210_OD1C00001G0257 [Parcubacteria bacterium RAAC4_OD1_1]HCY26499.1 hypothetical protein [Candidatus Nomurabacteria bacterium]